MQSILFSQMNLSDQVKKAVDDMGFEEATSIQAVSIPLIMEGRDVIGHSQTGTGKTAAFAIPAIEKIERNQSRLPQVLILCPTRELAVQACDEIKKFTKYKPSVRAVPIYGGQSIERQFTALRNGAQIIVGTPGRVMDHMRRGTLKLSSLTMIILDEADEMLSMGFREDIETILQDIPQEHQTILFSATMSADIIRITKQYQKDPELIKINHQQVTVPSIEQSYFEVPPGKKIEVLSRLLDVYNPRRSMVFCNTKRQVDELVSELQTRGYSAAGLHGDMKQNERTNVMNGFKTGRMDVLIATDVAARGIDVDNIEAVFNYDIPQDVEYYVHRIGRTGRAGKEGRSFTFVCGRRQITELLNIQRFTKSKIELKAVPTSTEVVETKSKAFVKQVSKIIEGGGLDSYNTIVDTLLEDYSSVEVAAALIKMLLGKDGNSLIPNASDDAIFLAVAQKARREYDGYGTPRRREFGRERGDRKPKAGQFQPAGGRRVPGARRSGADANMENIYIGIGRQNRVSVNHILGAVAGETGLPGKDFGRIEIYDQHSTVGVPKESVAHVIDCMKDAKIMGRKVTVRKA